MAVVGDRAMAMCPPPQSRSPAWICDRSMVFSFDHVRYEPVTEPPGGVIPASFRHLPTKDEQSEYPACHRRAWLYFSCLWRWVAAAIRPPTSDPPPPSPIWTTPPPWPRFEGSLVKDTWVGSRAFVLPDVMS